MQVRGYYKCKQNTIRRTERKRNDLVLTDVGGRILKLKFLNRVVNILNGLIEIGMSSNGEVLQQGDKTCSSIHREIIFLAATNFSNFQKSFCNVGLI